MKKSIYYYKELTAAEIGDTKTHEKYIRLPNNFDYEEFFNGEAKQEESVIEFTFRVKNLTNGESDNLRFVYFNKSNNEKRIPSLGTFFRKNNVSEGDVVCLESRFDDDKIEYYITFYRKGTIKISPSSFYFSQTGNEKTKLGVLQNKTDTPTQVIYFGAPGTGKSFAVNAQVGGKKNPNVVRTTFHPDSDYSTFVGAYKPTMSKAKEQLYSKDELTDILAGMQDEGISYPSQKFGYKYWSSLKKLTRSEKKDILAKCGMTDNLCIELDKGIAVGEEAHQTSGESQIGYSFVPQAFLNAYTMAYKKPNEMVYLVIEEINRGNCAQIFGDIFQLLDRGEDGVSTYENTPDVDLQKYLSEKLADCDIADPNIKSGAKMKLPSNLSIIATMNTSDQSLFPIDSAFKRRWDWKYIPINKTEEGHYIECGGEKYDWWNFLEKVNPRIEQTTGSEDKQLGFWFAKPDTGEDNLGISAEKFVSKVVFYLWNDVFKDYASDANNVFKTEDRLLKFREFFDKDGNVDLSVLKKFLQALEIEHQASSSEGDKDTASEPNE